MNIVSGLFLLSSTLSLSILKLPLEFDLCVIFGLSGISLVENQIHIPFVDGMSYEKYF